MISHKTIQIQSKTKYLRQFENKNYEQSTFTKKTIYETYGTKMHIKM